MNHRFVEDLRAITIVSITVLVSSCQITHYDECSTPPSEPVNDVRQADIDSVVRDFDFWMDEGFYRPSVFAVPNGFLRMVFTDNATVLHVSADKVLRQTADEYITYLRRVRFVYHIRDVRLYMPEIEKRQSSIIVRMQRKAYNTAKPSDVEFYEAILVLVKAEDRLRICHWTLLSKGNTASGIAEESSLQQSKYSGSKEP